MRVRVLSVAASLAGVLIAGSRLWGQQAQRPVAPMPPERADALIEAASRRLDYIPGEVLVKFKRGTGLAQQQRALDGVRSRPSAESLEWTGGVALLRDPSQPDANILADQLRSQPEVVYAEPNYLRHHFNTPNDPGYSPRQWNLQSIDMPRAWDINPGGGASTIVAVVDTGVTTFNGSMTFATWNGSAIQNVSIPFTTNPDLSSSRLVSPIAMADRGCESFEPSR